MMSIDQEKAVKEVYKNFITNDYQRNWNRIDELLYALDYLSDEQTIIESEVQIYRHSLGDLKCAEDHGESVCIVPLMMDAVNAICELYQEHKNLHEKNRYILQNYLAASQAKLIYVEEND